MSKVTHRKDHKQKLQTFKQKQKQMSKEQTPPQMPEIRNVPTWDKEADIELKGYEWEVLYNSIANLQILQQVAQGVMSRNVLNGTINMDFQKLDPTNLSYVDMTDEEKAPYKKDFATMIEKMKSQQEKQAQPETTDKQDAIIVEDVSTNTEDKGAKIVTMS
jgi:hypothetical protein